MGQQLRSKGVGAEVKHASVVTIKELLWTQGILGWENPKPLVNAVFYFCLRGGTEHRQLKLSQIKWYYDPDRYAYTKMVLKCLSECSIENKSVPMYSCFEQVGQCCHVYLLDLYIDRRPKKLKRKIYFTFIHFVILLPICQLHGTITHL